MPSRFTLRMQFGPHQDIQTILPQLEQLIQDAPIDEIMFFFFAEELNDGHDTLERIQQWIDHSRPYRQMLLQRGIQVSLNPWHSLLHCDRGRRLKPGQNWQLMVDPNGKEASAVVCFLDPQWQAYFFETLRRYAREPFRVVWIDDDIRYHNHDPLTWGGCFCPLHVEAFNRRANLHADRGEIVQACLAPGAPHPWRELWMDTWQDTILSFLNQCRQILNTGGVQMGLMSSGMESHAAEGRHWQAWWQTFSPGKPPIHRPHFWTYGNTAGPNLIRSIAALDQNRSIQPQQVESGPEIENFPYGRWNKSFRQTFAQMALAHILGSTHLNISLFDFMGNRFDDEPERISFLKQVRPSLDWLADQFSLQMKSIGVGIPWSEDLGRAVHTEIGSTWFELQPPSQSWSWWLGAAGISFSARPQDAVNAIAGSAAWSFDDDTLKQWLSKGLLLDGTAAAILMERGMGKCIGMTNARWITQEDVLYSIESCHSGPFALRQGGQISVNSKAHTQKMLQADLMDGAKAISALLDPLQNVVGHGAVIFINDLGGKTAVVPWNAAAVGGPENITMDIHRAVQLQKLVQWLSGSVEIGRVEGSAWLIPQFLQDGLNWRGVVWNAGPDEVDAFKIYRPSGMPPIRQAWHLTWKGTRDPVHLEGDTLRLDRPMVEWDLIVLMD